MNIRNNTCILIYAIKHVLEKKACDISGKEMFVFI